MLACVALDVAADHVLCRLNVVTSSPAFIITVRIHRDIVYFETAL